MRLTTRTFSKCLFAVAALAAMSAAALLTTGCGMGSSAAAGSGLGSQVVSGHAMGGNGPIGGAAVKLLLAGTTGYGLAGTVLATTTTATDGTGSFSIVPTSYVCPAGGQVYVEVLGGDPAGGTAASNTAIGLVAPVGTCGALATATIVNEATTVATTFAAAQFFNATSETFGSAASAQSQLGLANAFALALQIAPTSTGGVQSSYTPASSVSGVTVTATPEYAKINGIADILASCVNTTASTSNACTDLFNSAVGPNAAAITSGSTHATGTGVFAKATDTLIAAYYMAINPVSAGTTSGTSGTNAACFAAGGAGGSSASNLTCLYDLIGGVGAPFDASGLTGVPTDWTLGITYTSTGSCPGGGNFINGTWKSAIDANGNVWFISGADTNANIGEISPFGQPINCYGNGLAGKGITIDPTGNVWSSFNSASHLATDIEEIPVGSSSPIAWPVTGSTPYSIVSDGLGNIFYTTIGTGGGLAEFISPGTTTTPFPSNVVVVSGLSPATGNNSTSGLITDGSNRIWETFSTSSGFAGVYPGTAATAVPITAFQIATNVVTFTATNTYTAGNVVTIAGLSTGMYLNGQSLSVISATGTQFTVAFTHADVSSTVDSGTATLATSYTNGNVTPKQTSYGLAADSGGLLYSGTTCCNGTTFRLMEKFTPGSTPGATTFSFSAQDIAGINGVRSVALDGAGNVWAGNEFQGSGTTLTNGTYGISELTTSGSGTSATFTAISPGSILGSCATGTGCPSGGYLHTGIGYTLDLEIDPSGNVWVMNNGTQANQNTGTTIEEVIGAAVPVVTPLSLAAKNGTLATKP